MYLIMDEVINVFLPMRAGSQRVLKKNTRPFANISGGLCKIKVRQLLNCKKVNDIYVSTDDPTVIQVCNELGNNRIKTILRSSHLASSSASTRAASATDSLAKRSGPSRLGSRAKRLGDLPGAMTSHPALW